jgi:hypothetical protein
MAYVEERKSGWLVVWREAETGKKRSRLIAWGKPGTLGEDFTKDEARKSAEALAEQKRQTERAFRKPLERVTRQNAEDYPGSPSPFAGLLNRGEERYLFANYIRGIVDGNRELQESTRELYLRNIRVHIDGTALGDTDIRDVTPEMLSDYWGSLDTGTGARRNVQQLLSKALNRAVLTGLVDVSPLKRAPDVKRPPRGRREEVRPLTVEQVEKLADSAKHPRDRLEILVMAYGGLRAGEVGGLRVEDIDFKRCQLRLRQQVVRVTGRGQYVSPLKTRGETHGHAAVLAD